MSVTKLAATVAAATFIVALTSLAIAQPPGRPIERPQWQVGDTWTYTVATGGRATYKVVAATRGGYVVEYRTLVATSLLQFTQDLTVDRFWFTLPRWPIVIGSPAWSLRKIGPHGRLHVISNQAVGSDIVRVGAGTFEAVHIHGQDCQPHFALCGGFDWWYAPLVKWDVKRSWTSEPYWPSSLQGRSVELVSYRLHPPAWDRASTLTH